MHQYGIQQNMASILIVSNVANSSDKGMNFLIGSDWRDLFDVVIVQARKPKFFTDHSRPFRIYDLNQSTHVWDRVTQLEKGNVYFEVSSFIHLIICQRIFG